MQLLSVSAGAAAKAGPTIAVASGASTIMGLPIDYWTVIGIIGGLLVGLLGIIARAWIDWLKREDARKHKVAELNLKLSQTRKK